MRDIYHALLRKLAHVQVEHPFLTIALILALTIAMFGGASLLRTNASLEQMMPQDIEEIKAFNTLRDQDRGQDLIVAAVRVDKESTDPNGVHTVLDYRVYEHLQHLETLLQDNADVRTVQTYATFLPQGLGEAQYADALADPQAQKARSDYVNHDASTTIVVITTDISADDARMNRLADEIRSDIASAGNPPGTRTQLTGTPIIQQRLGTLIAHDRQSTQWISTLFVFLITALIFFSFSSAIVPIIVVTISVNWLYGTMGYTGLPISTLAGGVAAMVIGIGIDFAIHIINKFKYERKKGHGIRHSVECAVVETGTALTATSLTTIAAFLAFLIGTMPEMNRFGLLMAIGIAYALTFSLVGLPALLVIEEKILYWIRDHGKFGLEREFTLKGGKKNA